MATLARVRLVLTLWLRCDAEASRAFAALLYFPHRRVGRFEVARKAFTVEERAGIAIMRQLRFDIRKQRRIPRKLQGQRFILVEAARHQFGQADSVKEAS